MTAAIAFVLVVSAVLGYLWRTDRHNTSLIARCAARHDARARSGALNEGFDLVHRGVALWLRGFRQSGEHELFIEVRAAVRVRPGVRIWMQNAWTRLAATRMSSDLRALPWAADLRRGDVRTDRPDVLASVADALRAWTTIASHHDEAMLACDGRAVTCIVSGDSRDEVLEAMLDAVAILAAWDDGFTALLHALPRATPLDSPTLAPAVSLAPDGLVLGVRSSDHLVAHLDARIDGEPSPTALAHFAAAGGSTRLEENRASYEWPSVERDPNKIRSAIDGLRALRATTPYR